MDIDNMEVEVAKLESLDRDSYGDDVQWPHQRKLIAVMIGSVRDPPQLKWVVGLTRHPHPFKVKRKKKLEFSAYWFLDFIFPLLI